MNQPLVSVIICAYNPKEKLLDRCLKSILEQTYRRIEIILVNDGSKPKFQSIMKRYQSQDNRIIYVEHEKNLGLFQARITGYKKSRGELITFVDSDDYFYSIDYIRRLVDNAIKTNADITFGNFFLEENKRKVIFNISDLPADQVISNQNRALLSLYFAQRGLNFAWSLIISKLYTRRLWTRALPYLEKQKEHLVMLEDIAFSTVLFALADQACFLTVNDYYAYFKSADSVTGSHKNAAQLKKYIKDIQTCFSFIHQFLKEIGLAKIYQNDFNGWLSLYARMWRNSIQHSRLSPTDKTSLISYLKVKLKQKKILNFNDNDNYFYKLQTEINPQYELLKRKVASSKYRYISFDLFDTLVVRPFWEPHDLFKLLDRDFQKLNQKTIINFHDLRLRAESAVRQEKWRNGSKEEITLDEIYLYIEKNYQISKTVLDVIKRKEINLELEFCTARKSVLEIYNLAVYLNKKIICISDTYLPRRVIKKILTKNGYTRFERVFLSSEVKLTKHTGHLFGYVVNQLKCQPSAILHIGNDYFSDIKSAERNNFAGFFYPSPTAVFKNEVSSLSTSDCGALFIQNKGLWVRTIHALFFLGIRCMLALAANKYFDNPFRPFNRNSDFNADPYFVGYYPLGMHLLAVDKWLMENVIETRKTETIQFMARDGYLAMKGWEILNKVYHSKIKTNYLYINRRVLIPLFFTDKIDFFYLFNITKLESILNYSRPIIGNYSELMTDLKRNKINYRKNINNPTKVLKVIMKHIDSGKQRQYSDLLKRYFTDNIGKYDAIFDIGYSSRPLFFIKKLTGLTTESYFIHVNQEEAAELAAKASFKIKTFYDFTPAITGVAREIIMSESHPACIDFCLDKNDLVQPVFEDQLPSYQEKIAAGLLEKGVLDFIGDYTGIFKKYFFDLHFRYLDASLPVEMFLEGSKKFDRDILSCFTFDDSVGGLGLINAVGFWENELASRNINNFNTPIELGQIKRSTGYRFLLKWYKIRDLFIPENSRRRKLLKKIFSQLSK